MLQYLYQYLVGGLIFFVGLVYAWRQGDVGVRGSRPLRNLAVMLGGVAFFALVHAFFQFVAPRLTLSP